MSTTPAESGAACESRQRSFRKLSILLVDDTPANQKTIANVLQKRGHVVVVAENGRQALRRLHDESGRFHVVLMDIQMPDMDGYAATAEIRHLDNAEIRSIPIIGMTAQGDRERCLDAGMDAYVAKPIDVSKLIELVETISDRAAAAAKTADSDAAATGASSDSGVLNLQAALKRLGGDTDLLRNFVEVYHEDSPKLLDAIGRAVDHGDGPALQRAAHSLKGLAANFDAREVVEVAGRLEQIAQSSKMGEALRLRDELSLAIESFNDALARSY